MNICMLCYLNDVDYNFFCCNKCLLKVYEYSICNQRLKLMEVIKQLHHKNIYKIDIKNNYE